MKLLFVAATLPFPPLTGSALITLNHIRVLSGRHTIDLISFKDRANPNSLGELAGLCRHIELVDRPPRWRVLLAMLARVAIDPVPEISRFRSPKMSKAVDARLSNTAYDVVLFQTVQSAQFLPNWYRGPTIWSLEDPPALKTRSMMAMYPWYLRPLYRRRSNRLKKYDLSNAKRFGCVTFVNKDDAVEYTNMVPGACTDYVPHGVDEESSPEPAARTKGMIVMTGNMYHVPNVDAVEFFCRDIFPLVSQQEPCANLWLVGARPVKSVRKWADDPRIKVTGFVPDVRTYLRQAAVSICPVRLPIGTQTKILEALVCGTPVVTCSAGNHGIGATSGEHLYVADDPVAFANHVVALLRGQRWDELSQNGRRFVGSNFSWERSTVKLEQIMERLTRKREANLVSA